MLGLVNVLPNDLGGFSCYNRSNLLSYLKFSGRVDAEYFLVCELVDCSNYFVSFGLCASSDEGNPGEESNLVEFDQLYSFSYLHSSLVVMSIQNLGFDAIVLFRQRFLVVELPKLLHLFIE